MSVAPASWATYALPLTEQGSTAYYLGSFPAVPAGRYQVVIRRRGGATPAPTDPGLASGGMDWTGAAEAGLTTGTQILGLTERQHVADTLLKRSLAAAANTSAESGGAPAPRNLLDAIRSIRNRVVIAGGVRTIYSEDDLTPAFTEVLVTDAGAAPVVAKDPT